MPFKVVRNDLVKMKVDAIVNTANPMPAFASGTDALVYHAAGAEDLLKARKKIGQIAPGEAFATPAFKLQAKIIIHTVGPFWEGGDHNEEELLAACYRNSLVLAKKKKCESIAFPLISTGNNGFPKELALQIVIGQVSSFLLENDMMIYLVVYGDKETRLSEQLFDSIDKYIDDQYVKAHREASRPRSQFERSVSAAEYTSAPRRRAESFEANEALSDQADICFGSADFMVDYAPVPEQPKASSAPVPHMEQPKASQVFAPKGSTISRKRSLKDLLARKPETFQQMLLRLIKEKNLTNAQAYSKANQDKKLFSKIKNNVDYQPSKKTVFAFALALELSLDETKDLLASAGFAFAPANKFDTAIRFFIETEMYNIYEVECTLFDMGLETLCNY